MRTVTSIGDGERHALAAWMLVVAVLAAPAAHAGNESLVSDQFDLIDSEFSQSRAMITWCDSTGGLWIADIDRDTGLFVPSDGKGTLIDQDAMRLEDLQIIGNGPEWISAAHGDQIVYTKFLPGEEHTVRSARLAVAGRRRSGDWSHTYLSPALRRNGPYASHDPGDALPRISYVDPIGNHYWRNPHDASSETRLTMVPNSSRSIRFVEGEQAMVFVTPVDGISQIFYLPLDTGIPAQVTFDAGNKDLHTVPWSWRAPEFGGDLVIATVVEDTELRIYRLSADASEQDPAWRFTYSARTPPNGVINSPEPFVHNGKSYVVLSAGVPPYTLPSVIFLATIDPANPEMVQLTPDFPLRLRRDPEIFVTSHGPYVYYNRLQLSDELFCPACNEGVYRSYTGLPPAQE